MDTEREVPQILPHNALSVARSRRSLRIAGSLCALGLCSAFGLTQIRWNPGPSSQWSLETQVPLLLTILSLALPLASLAYLIEVASFSEDPSLRLIAKFLVLAVPIALVVIVAPIILFRFLVVFL